MAAKFETLSDVFSGSSLDTTKWDSSGSVASTVSDGQLHLLAGSSFPYYSYIQSKSAYTLVNSHVFIRVISAPDQVNSVTTLDVTATTGSFEVYWRLAENVLTANTSTATVGGSLAYNSAVHRFLRIRATTTTVFWDYSTDGTTWVNFTSDSSQTITDSKVAVTFADGINTGTGLFTQFNSSSALYNLAVSDTGSTDSAGEIVFHKEAYSMGTDNASFSNGSYLSAFQPLSHKDYEYRVFDHSGSFIGIWQDVTSDFAYQQSINQVPTELTVDIARSPNNLIVKYDPLLDTSGAPITDTNGNPIYLSTQTPNSVGAGTDVMENYDVDVYAFYGGYEELLDTTGNAIQDTNGENILVGFGAPNGRRVYSGYIVDYDMKFGAQTGVSVTIAPHSAETQQYVFMATNGDTTVSYNSVDPVQMARDAMDSYTAQGGDKITYTPQSMPLSGSIASYDFKLQTVRQSIDKDIDLLPSGYYQFVDPGENIQYLLNKGTTADHTFIYEKHINDMDLRKSISQLVNDVYFVGGDPGTGSPLYKHYSDASSISTYRRGLQLMSDSRVTLEDSASALANQQIDQFKNPRYRTSVTIDDADYDIESIKLGQMVGFQNFGNFVDSLVLQIVSINRQKHQVTLDLDMIVPNDTKRLYELKKEMQAEQVRGIAVAPA